MKTSMDHRLMNVVLILLSSSLGDDILDIEDCGWSSLVGQSTRYGCELCKEQEERVLARLTVSFRDNPGVRTVQIKSLALCSGCWSRTLTRNSEYLDRTGNPT